MNMTDNWHSCAISHLIMEHASPLCLWLAETNRAQAAQPITSRKPSLPSLTPPWGALNLFNPVNRTMTTRTLHYIWTDSVRLDRRRQMRRWNSKTWEWRTRCRYTFHYSIIDLQYEIWAWHLVLRVVVWPWHSTWPKSFRLSYDAP